MNRVFDNIFFTSFDLKHVHRKDLSFYKKNPKWQCIVPSNDLELNYEVVLNKSKKILLLGYWRDNAKWFRFFKSRGYRVYLEKKDKLNKKVK